MKPSIWHKDLTRHISSNLQLRAFLALRAEEIVATWPDLEEDVVLLKRVPSHEKYGSLLWGTRSRGFPGRLAAFQTRAVERLVQDLECQVYETPEFGSFAESGWLIVARLSRDNIGAILEQSYRNCSSAVLDLARPRRAS